MSEFLLIIVWFISVMILSNILTTKQYIMVDGKKKLRENLIFSILVFAPVLYIVTMRSNRVGDTSAYEQLFKSIPNTIQELLAYIPQVNKDKGFSVLTGIIKIVFGDNVRLYFFVIALMQGIPLIYIYRKYSINYVISLFLFIASTDYISWMYNGIRQFIAVAIIFAATPLMLKKDWFPLVLIILLTSTIHGSALLMLPVIFIVQGNAWNKKTIMFIIVCVFSLAFAEKFTDILDTLLSDTQYTNVVSDWKNFNDDGTNPIRVLVYSIPAILSLFGMKWIDTKNDNCINLCVNMSIISAAIYLVSIGTSGIFLGRLPIYTSLYGYILLPYLLERIFTKNSKRIVELIMIIAYLLFYYYQIHFAWNLI